MTDATQKPTQHTGLNGWVEAGLFVVTISVLNIVYTAASQLGVPVTVFITYAMASAAVGMLAWTGLGDDWRAVIAAPPSWIFGLTAVGLEGTYFLLLAFMAPAEATLTVRLTVPISCVIGWWFFNRQFGPLMALGSVIIIAAVIPIFTDLPSKAVWPAVVLGTACSAIVSIKTFASEFHPWNRRADTIREKMRVTGLVVLTASIVLGVTVAALRLATDVGLMHAADIIPAWSAFADFNALWLGLLVGAPLLIAMNYLTFSSVVKIRTENFLATSALTPLVAWVTQVAAEAAGLINTTAMGWTLLPLTALGLIGVLFVVWGGRVNDAKS